MNKRLKKTIKKFQASELAMTRSIGRITAAEYQEVNNYEYLLWIKGFEYAKRIIYEMILEDEHMNNEGLPNEPIDYILQEGGEP